MKKGKPEGRDTQMIQQCLELAANKGLREYKNQVTNVVNSNKPFKDKQLLDFHAKTKETIIQAFQQTFGALKVNPETRIIFQNATDKLEKDINWQLPTTLKRFEVNMERITARVKYCVNCSLNHYDGLMMEFAPSEATKSEIRAKHEKSKDEALAKFTEDIEKEGLEFQSDWKLEVLSGLEERLAVMMEECLETSLILLGKEENDIPVWLTNYFEPGLFESTISKNIIPSGLKTLIVYSNTNNQQPGPNNVVGTINTNTHSHDLTSLMAALNSTGNNPAISEPTLNLAQPDFVGGTDETIQGISNLMEPNNQPVMYLDVDKSSVTTTEELKEQQNNVSESFTNYSESSLPDPTENISHAILHSESKPLFQDTITNDQEPGRSSSDETDYRINYSHNNELTSQTAAFNSTDNNPVISEPTLTLAQLDSVGGKDETIQGVSNLMEPNKQPVMYLDVGVYFDKTSVTVGRINPESLQLDVLMTTSPQIAFHENSVNIGEDASKYKNHRNHIHIFDTSVSGTFTITMNSEEKIRLNWTSVLTAFFMKLRIGLLTKTGHQSIRNAVLTIPYATTSIERRSIKMAAKNAFENVRVVSSILSTAVTYAANTQFYIQEEKDQKAHSVFVAQSVRKEFVMAAVEIGPDEIVTKSIITSKNLPECSNYEFLNTQLKLFNGERQTSSKSEKQYNIYKRAAQQLCDSVVNGNKCAEHALFIRSSKNLDRFYNSIFKEQVLNYFEVNEGPLFGACILAERLHPSMYRLPPNIPICDKSWTTFSIDFGPAEGSVQTPTSFSYNGPEIVELNQSAITEREVHLPPLQFRKGFSRVVLSETFLSWKMPLEVDAHYFLDDTHGTEGQVVIIGLKCDEDGVVKIVVDEVNINSLAPIPDFT